MRKWLLAGLILSISAVGYAQEGFQKLRTFGAENPTIIYVFTSPSCPHCAAYHTDILPGIISKFADTGKAQVKIVDMAYDSGAMKVARIARCLSDEQYHDFMGQVYRNLGRWGWMNNKIESFAQDVGIKPDVYQPCLTTELTTEIKQQRDNLADLYRVQYMPTTVVVSGHKSSEFIGADKTEILKELDKLLP